MGWFFIGLMLLFLALGNMLLSEATEIAIRRGTNVWTASRPEAGGALILYAMACVCVIAARGLS